jgi:hypothetical protein
MFNDVRRNSLLSVAGTFPSKNGIRRCGDSYLALFRCLGRTKVSVQVRSFVCEHFVTKIKFYSEELLALRPTPRLEDHTLLAVRDCLFNIFAATLHIRSRSSIHNPRTRHAVVTGTHLQHLAYTAVYCLTARTVQKS